MVATVNFVPDASNIAINRAPASRVGGRERVNVGLLSIGTATLAANDVLILARVPSDSVLLEISIGHDDLDGGGTPSLLMDVGLCDMLGNNLPGSADSRQCFTNAYSALAAVVLTDRRFPGATPANVANMNQFAWQLAGMPSDPAKPVFVCLRVSTLANGAAVAPGDIFWRIRFLDNS